MEYNENLKYFIKKGVKKYKWQKLGNASLEQVCFININNF